MLNDLIQLQLYWRNQFFKCGCKMCVKRLKRLVTPGPSLSGVSQRLPAISEGGYKSKTSPNALQVWLIDMIPFKVNEWITFHDLTFYHFSVPVSRLPWKDDLIDTNKLFVPNLENLANIVGTRPLKRPAGDHGGGAAPGEEKRNCPEPQPLLPL